MQWSADNPSLVCFFSAPDDELDVENPRHVLMLFHAGGQAREFTLPSLPQRIKWQLFLDTGAESPHDVYPVLDGPPPNRGRMRLERQSMAVFVSGK